MKKRGRVRECALWLVATTFLACHCSPGAPPPPPTPEEPRGPWRQRQGALLATLDTWEAVISPETLAIVAFTQGATLPVAQGLPPGPVQELRYSGDTASFLLPEEGLRVSFQIKGDVLLARLVTEKEERLFSRPTEAEPVRRLFWPGDVAGSSAQGLIVPISEGLYLPADDPHWLSLLKKKECFDTHGGLSLPLFGQQFPSAVVTYLFLSDLQNRVCLKTQKDRLGIEVSHDFRVRDQLPPYEIAFTLTPPSPISPALFYKRWLREAGELPTLEEKARQVPEVEKLFGATHAYLYGDGRTLPALEDLQKLGLDRMWLGYDQDETEGPYVISDAFVRSARELGFLVGPYDTHDNIQDPERADTPTSIYDEELFAQGGVLASDGTRVKGFGGRGLLLSSEALRKTGFYQARVESLAAKGINSYFLDCDAFGSLYDDFDPNHPMTPARDRENRLDRLRYLSQEKKLVTGSESAAAWSVSALHFSHGPHTIQNRVFWEALGDSAYFGGYRPFRRADLFFKTIEATEALRLNFDPSYRIPLYQAAFHDALVSTDRWELSPVKLRDLVQVRALLQLLYGAPPLWSLDRKEIREQGRRLLAHHRFFSPIHRAIGSAPLLAFQWLTEDRLVQKTRFAGLVEMTANFSATTYDGIEPLCIRCRWQGEEREEIFCPAP